MQTPTHSGQVLVLNAGDATFKDAVIFGQGLPLEKEGQPVRYFWKEVLRPGKYLDKNQQPFEITASRIDTLRKNFDRAKSKGFLPSLPSRHEKNGASNFGWVVDTRTNDRGGLELLHQAIGDDAIKAIARNKSSICTVANVVDETGESFSELIDHNAIVPDPQLNNLQDFVPALAASRAATESAIVLTPAADTERSPSVDITKLREAVGAAKEVTDEQVIANAVTKLTESGNALQLSRSTADTTKTELDTVKGELATANAKVLELSRTPDVEILRDRASIKSDRIDFALEKGQCTKAQADLLKAALKDGDKPAALMLSKSGDYGTPVDLVLKVLELNKPLAGLQLSGAQRMPDPNDPNPTVTPERKKELLAHTGL